jgi:O-succinylbenzoic acid--CoA ligase
VLTAGNHLWSALGSAARLGAHRDDRWLACLPLSHVGGLAVVLRAAIHGATVVLQHGFDVEEVARALRDERVTLVSLVPTALGRLASLRPPPTLRCALIGGAAASPGVLASAHSRGWPVAPTYGCTEAASQVATAPPGTLDGVGQPILPTRVRIVRSDGGTAAVDEDGEIHVSGPTVTPGYAEPDGSLRPSARDGWLRTGDLGRLDGAGALRVLGRRDDVIVTGGENVAPAEVEAVLGALPAVAEVAVAGVDDAEWGRAVAAWVVPRPGAAPTLAALRDAARGRLAAHKLPRRLYLVDALPRTAAGKVRRSALRAPGD